MSSLIFEKMIGETVTKIDKPVNNNGNGNGDELTFYTKDGHQFCFYHEQDCCEYVYIEDICGDLNDLIGSPLLEAEEVFNMDGPEIEAESYTWTFYKFATIKGSVTIRWLGTPNVYYSEGVTFKQVS